VLSSSDLSGNQSELIALASSRFNGKRELVELIIFKFDAFFVGTGDLFASLFLAWFTRSGHDLKTSCEKTVSTLQLILKRTFDYASKQTGGTKMSANIELRLIQSLNDIQNPKSIVKAIILE
jgi:pyridoxine kinase